MIPSLSNPELREEALKTLDFYYFPQNKYAYQHNRLYYKFKHDINKPKCNDLWLCDFWL